MSSRGKGGASFPLQLLLIIALLSCPVWVITTIALLIYKGSILPYPPAALPMEIIGVVLCYGVQYFACSFGKRGNLTETTSVLIVSVVLLLIAGIGMLYYMWLQTYVMMLDLGMSASVVAINGLTVLCAIAALQSAAGSDAVMQMSPAVQQQAQQPRYPGANAGLPPLPPVTAPPGSVNQ